MPGAVFIQRETVYPKLIGIFMARESNCVLEAFIRSEFISGKFV